MKRSKKTSFRAAMALLLAMLPLEACGRYPAAINSEADIAKTPTDYYSINIVALPIEAYPKLRKFAGTREIRFLTRNGGATDKQLLALAAVPGLRVVFVNLHGSTLVSDAGVIALSSLPHLQGLSLVQTGVTDAGLDVLSKKAGFESILVHHCRNVTIEGLQVLAAKEDMRNVGFSTENLSAEQVLLLLSSFPKVARWSIVDPDLKLKEGGVDIAVRKFGDKVDLRREYTSSGYP